MILGWKLAINWARSSQRGPLCSNQTVSVYLPNFWKFLIFSTRVSIFKHFSQNAYLLLENGYFLKKWIFLQSKLENESKRVLVAMLFGWNCIRWIILDAFRPKKWMPHPKWKILRPLWPLTYGLKPNAWLLLENGYFFEKSTFSCKVSLKMNENAYF